MRERMSRYFQRLRERSGFEMQHSGGALRPVRVIVDDVRRAEPLETGLGAGARGESDLIFDASFRRRVGERRVRARLQRPRSGRRRPCVNGMPGFSMRAEVMDLRLVLESVL